MQRKNHIKILTFLIILSALCFNAVYAEDNDYIRWLESNSMLHQAEQLAQKFMGSQKQWQHPYGLPQPKRACEMASVWFTAYPASTITRPGESIVQTLGDEKLWQAFREIGIEAMHTGPLKRAGGVVGRKWTPSVDGGFDRISLSVDPLFGPDEQYVEMVKTAGKNGAIIAGDIVPGHTGKGPDFRLALMKYKDFPGIFHLIEIKKEDWGLLPELPEGSDTKNLSPDTVKKLKDKGYIVGKLQRVIFEEPGVKDTNWSATAIVKGVDGVDRRWVYLHYFKEGQPTLNWLDPSFAANRMITGDILKSVDVLGAKIIRLDANGFLGVEPVEGKLEAWSEGHPLSVISTTQIAMMIRKMGGFSFEELNLALEDLGEFTRYGPDLSYDFVSRPAFYHAVLMQDGEFLRMMHRLMKKFEIKPVSLIHALQNHDEITHELVHFADHPGEKFMFHGKMISGKEIRDRILKEAKSNAAGEKAPYNKLSGNGLCTTSAGYCAAAVGVKDINNITADEKEKIKKAHLLLAMYNAMQPGVFALSGWDIVGALPLPEETIKPLLADGDYRWINRGSYDLMGFNRDAKKSEADLPRAKCLYGTIPEQLKEPGSFASQLKKMLEIRKKFKIYLSEQISVPDAKNTQVVLMIHKLPEDKGFEVTALNFGQKSVVETAQIKEIAGLEGMNLLNEKNEGKASGNGNFDFSFEPLEGKILLFRTK